MRRLKLQQVQRVVRRDHLSWSLRVPLAIHANKTALAFGMEQHRGWTGNRASSRRLLQGRDRNGDPEMTKEVALPDLDSLLEEYITESRREAIRNQIIGELQQILDWQDNATSVAPFRPRHSSVALPQPSRGAARHVASCRREKFVLQICLGKAFPNAR